MDVAVSSLFVLTAVTGATELIKRLWAKDFQAATIIGVSAAIGALAGVFVIDDLSVASGLVAGLSASGLVTLAQKFGQGTAVAPSSPSDIGKLQG
jgi:hypothetical protein